MSHTKSREIKNKLFTWTIYVLCGLSMLPLFFIFSFITKKGISAISWDFITKSASQIEFDGGGISNALSGTFMIVALASVIALPIGVLIGTFLAEYPKLRLAKITSLAVEILHGVPSIVIGIVAWIWVVRPSGGFSGYSGSIALSIMMMPVVIRSTEETLKLLPKSMKEASLALGAPYWKTILCVILPAGLSGIVTGGILGVARIAGETAPLIFTALGSRFLHFNMGKEMETLPTLIYNYARDPSPALHEKAWGAALILLIGILTLNILSRHLASKWKWY